MIETVILGKVSKQLEKLCRENNIIKLQEIVVEVDSNSQVNNEILKSYLKEYNNPLVGEFTEIIVNIEEYEEESAVILSLKGESVANLKVHEY